MIVRPMGMLAAETSLRGDSARNTIGGAQARENATLSLLLGAPIAALVVPDGPTGHLFNLATEMVLGGTSNPANAYEIVAGFPNVLRFNFSLGQGAIHFSLQALMAGNYGNRIWTLRGEVAVPPNSFAKPTPDAPDLVFDFTGRTSTLVDELKIGDKITAIAPDVNGITARLRLFHDDAVARTIRLDEVTESQDYGGNGVPVTI